jgi:hypothetical protein
VQRQGVVRPREARVKPVAQHRARPRDNLLRRLRHEDDRAAPAILQRCEHARRADQAGHMKIVPAGVHRRLVAAHQILDPRAARPGHAGLLLHGQSVHVAPHQHGRTRAVFQHPDHAGVADLLGHLDAEGAQLLRHQRGGLRLHERQLGVRVQLFVDRLERGVLGIHPGRDDTGDFRRGGGGQRSNA